MTIGINFDKDDDRDIGPLSHWLEDLEDKDTSLFRKYREEISLEDSINIPFSKWKENRKL